MTKQEKGVVDFVELLARTPAPPNSVNPWDYSYEKNEIRRQNLKTYLREVLKNGPTVLLVGEAPGYRGSRRTGVPFSSEKLILTHSFFTAHKEFAIEHTNSPIAEASASIVWKTLDELPALPLMWASFPFHPHHPGNDLTNRAPTKEELVLGRESLTAIIALSGVTQILAVGRAAERTLMDMEIPIAAHIRHPSHGGATQFREGLLQFTER